MARATTDSLVKRTRIGMATVDLRPNQTANAGTKSSTSPPFAQIL